MSNELTLSKLASYMDSTNLNATATTEDIRRLCQEAKEYCFASVCVNPRWVSFAKRELAGSSVKVCTVVGFPLGADITSSKIAICKGALKSGADEIDMVIDLAAAREFDKEYSYFEISSLTNICREYRSDIVIKVIIEAAALDESQKKSICKIASEIGVDFVKTSTGMHKSGGASVEDMKLMKESAPNCEVKASGGIRTLRDAMDMIDAGATRIGTSNAARICDELRFQRYRPDQYL